MIQAAEGQPLHGITTLLTVRPKRVLGFVEVKLGVHKEGNVYLANLMNDEPTVIITDNVYEGMT